MDTRITQAKGAIRGNVPVADITDAVEEIAVEPSGPSVMIVAGPVIMRDQKAVRGRQGTDPIRVEGIIIAGGIRTQEEGRMLPQQSNRRARGKSFPRLEVLNV